ncbi:MAG TPA: response regulator transcription factor [Acidimicrobiia bacterium]|nr:response regulator transcription factor [Acidimicrobiia bacterium]
MSSPRRPRLFIVEDHPLMLSGIQRALEERYDLVGSASETAPAIEMILDREPDLVLLDVRFEGGGGPAVIEGVKRHDNEIKFLAYTVSTSAEDVVRMFRVGVDGYVVKKADATELADNIDQVLAGGRPVSRFVANYLMQLDDVVSDSHEIEGLTPKEREVMTLIARGYRYREVAEELDISVKTLETHMKHIFDKLGVASRHEMTRIAFSTGFVDPD